VEQDALAIWHSVRLAVAQCLEGQDAGAVVAVGLSNQRESMLLWDRATGEPLGPMLSWQDQRGAAHCDALRAAGHAAAVQARSGLPLDPMFSAAKAHWLLRAYDPDGRRDVCLGTMDSWLLSRFGGEHVIEAGNAARTQLLHVADVAWDDALLGWFGVKRAALPRVVGSTGPFPAARGLAPLPDGVPVLAVMGDSHAALYAHGAGRPGVVKATYGTGSSIMGLVERPEALDPGLSLTIAWWPGCAAARRRRWRRWLPPPAAMAWCWCPASTGWRRPIGTMMRSACWRICGWTPARRNLPAPRWKRWRSRSPMSSPRWSAAPARSPACTPMAARRAVTR
jgi:glycerol kinase